MGRLNVPTSFTAGRRFKLGTDTYEVGDQVPSRDEVQIITLAGVADAGAFTLTFSGQTTGDLSRNTTASAVSAALVALSNIAPGDVAVTGPNGGPFRVRFAGAYENVNVPQITVTNSMTRVAAGVTVATVTPGIAATTDEVQSVTVNGSPVSGTFTLTYAGQTTTALAYNALTTEVQAALDALSNLAPDDVVVTGSNGGPWTLTFGGTLAQADVPEITATPTLVSRVAPTVTITTEYSGLSSLVLKNARNLSALVSRRWLIPNQTYWGGKAVASKPSPSDLGPSGRKLLDI